MFLEILRIKIEFFCIAIVWNSTICNIGNHTKGVAIAVTRMMKN